MDWNDVRALYLEDSQCTVSIVSIVSDGRVNIVVAIVIAVMMILGYVIALSRISIPNCVFVMDNMSSELTKVLGKYCLSYEQVMSYFVAGGLSNILRRTLIYYKELLLQCLARVNSVGWSVVMVDVK